MNYTHFDNINNKKSFFKLCRMCFDKKYALEQNILQIKNNLEFAKKNYNHDLYKDIIIELISIEKNQYQFYKIIDIYYNTAIYFKNNHRYDLCVLFYTNLIQEYNNRNLSEPDLTYLGNIHDELADVFIELNNYYESINHYVRATHYLYKCNYEYRLITINFKIAIVKILSLKFLDAIFIFEKLIFDNDKYLTNNNNIYITFIILCYICLFDVEREPYLQMNTIRKILENYKNKYIDYCETREYTTVKNIISSVDNLDNEQFTLNAKNITANYHNNIHLAFTTIFSHINKYLLSKLKQKF